MSYEDRCKLLSQRGLVVWFTGLPGSGKSTIAVEVERLLFERGFLSYRLDGDNIRHGLNSDLGFSVSDREENIRRVSEVALLLKDVGVIVLCCFISPLKRMRDTARRIVGDEDFLEVYVKADLELCAKRDPKGLYAKAYSGELSDFTGISQRYELPTDPDLVLDTEVFSVSECASVVLDRVLKRQNDNMSGTSHVPG